MNSRLKLDICHRLRFNGLYWDRRQKRFVSLESYFYFMWSSTYNLGQSFQVLLAFYLIYLGYEEPDFTEVNKTSKSLQHSNNDDKLISIVQASSYG